MSAVTPILDDIAVLVCFEISEIESDWIELQNSGFALPFQNYEWCKAWVDQCAISYAIRPLIVVGRDSAGQIVFVLPMQMRGKWGCQILEWLGQDVHMPCGGVFSVPFLNEHGEIWFEKNFLKLVELLGSVDVLNLRNMPVKFFGKSNPLKILHKTETANASFVLNLSSSYECILAKKRSSRSISKMRRRDERLSESGFLEFDVLTGAEAQEALADGLAHKNLQLSQAGVGDVFGAADTKFYQQILVSQAALLEVFRLRLNGSTVATMVGVKTHDHFWLLISALAPDVNLQFSPGDYLLRQTISHCCENGISVYDFSLGEQDYKQLWADEHLVYYNYIKSQTLRGKLPAFSYYLLQATKRMVKQNTFLKNAFFEFRQRVWGTKTKP